MSTTPLAMICTMRALTMPALTCLPNMQPECTACHLVVCRFIAQHSAPFSSMQQPMPWWLGHAQRLHTSSTLTVCCGHYRHCGDTAGRHGPPGIAHSTPASFEVHACDSACTTAASHVCAVECGWPYGRCICTCLCCASNKSRKL